MPIFSEEEIAQIVEELRRLMDAIEEQSGTKLIKLRHMLEEFKDSVAN